jgi:uncharacterized protein
MRSQRVTFESRSATISGELLVPAGTGPFPAVVLLPGSGSATRAATRTYAVAYAKRGIAALITDKRGSGRSTGDPDYSYAELTADARAAVALLRARPEVARKPIALWGFSEGANVAALAGAGNGSVAAILVVGAAALSPIEQQEWSVRNGLERDGAASQATALVTKGYRVIGGVGRSQWPGRLGERRVEDFTRFDPLPVWRGVSQPVLAVWGAHDDVVPAHDSAVRLLRALAGGKNRDRMFRTLNGGHALYHLDPDGRFGLAPGFEELTARWLRSRLAAGAPGRSTGDTPLPEPSSVVTKSVTSGPWYGGAVAQLSFAALALAVFLPGPLASLYRAIRRRDSGGEGSRLVTAVSVANLAFLVGLPVALGSIISARGKDVAMVAGLPVGVLVLDALALASLLLTSALVATTVRSKPGGGAVAVAAGSAAFLIFPAYWLAW